MILSGAYEQRKDRDMSKKISMGCSLSGLGVILAAGVWAGVAAGGHPAKEKQPAIDPNDPTLRLYQLIESSYGGKLDDFYLLADTYKDQKNPDQELQHVLRVEFDKNRAFG